MHTNIKRHKQCRQRRSGGKRQGSKRWQTPAVPEGEAADSSHTQTHTSSTAVLVRTITGTTQSVDMKVSLVLFAHERPSALRSWIWINRKFIALNFFVHLRCLRRYVGHAWFMFFFRTKALICAIKNPLRKSGLEPTVRWKARLFFWARFKNGNEGYCTGDVVVPHFILYEK